MAICSFGGIKDLEGVKLLEDFRSATYLPVGFGFRPTDTELVSYYLNGKINGSLRPIDEFMIPEIDVYRCDPWDAVGKSLFQSGDPVWYFFSPKNSKFPGGRRHNRATSSGSWKLTGTDREITELSGSLTGKKRTLIFYQHACTRTVWTIHEYTTTKEQDGYVLCRLLKKPDEVLLKKKESFKESASFDDANLKVADQAESSGMEGSCSHPTTTSSHAGKTEHGTSAAVETRPYSNVLVDLQNNSQLQHLTSNVQHNDIEMQFLNCTDWAMDLDNVFELEESYPHKSITSNISGHVSIEAETEVDYLNNDLSPLLYPECGILSPDGNHFDYLHEILQPFPTESFDQELLLKMTQNDNMDQTTHADCTYFDDFFSEI